MIPARIAERQRASVEAIAADPLSGRDVVCFCNDWNGDPLSKKHFMRLVAQNNRVLWVNSTGYRAPTVSGRDLRRAWNKLVAAFQPVTEAEPNLYVLNPVAIPAYGNPLAWRANQLLLQWQVKRAMDRLGFHRPINWVFVPTAAVVAGSLDEAMVIYHCVDEYTAFSDVSNRALTQLEGQLLRRADLVIVSAERLLRSKSQLNPRTFLVRHGVDHTHFRRALSPETQVPAEIARLPRPILGYFGLMSADWFDVNLMVQVARRFAHGSIVLLGTVDMNLGELERLPNVHILGRKPYESLPAYSKGFDVGLTPFPISEVTLNSNPLKVREYLAAGLPVVCTPVPEVESLGFCGIGKDAEAFCEQIELALKDAGPRRERSESVRSQSWEARLDEIRGHMAGLQESSSQRSGRGAPSRGPRWTPNPATDGLKTGHHA